MVRLTRILTAFLVLSLFTLENAEANYNITKIGDWKYRAYICKNALSSLASLIMQEQKNKIDFNDAKQQEEAEKAIQDVVLQEEKFYPFDKADAQFVGIVTFAIRTGMKGTGMTITPSTVVSSGFDVCIDLLDDMDKRLQNSTR